MQDGMEQEIKQLKRRIKRDITADEPVFSCLSYLGCSVTTVAFVLGVTPAAVSQVRESKWRLGREKATRLCKLARTLLDNAFEAFHGRSEEGSRAMEKHIGKNADARRAVELVLNLCEELLQQQLDAIAADTTKQRAERRKK